MSFDPGASTGVALRKNGEYSVWVVYDGNVKEVISHVTPDLDEVIYERFATSRRLDHWGLLTAEMCGAIQAAAHMVNMRLEYKWRAAATLLKCEPEELQPLHQIRLVRHEPANRIAFVQQATEMVRATFIDKGLKPITQVMDDGVSATAHLLCRETLGDAVRKNAYGKGISNV